MEIKTRINSRMDTAVAPLLRNSGVKETLKGLLTAAAVGVVIAASPLRVEKADAQTIVVPYGDYCPPGTYYLETINTYYGQENVCVVNGWYWTGRGWGWDRNWRDHERREYGERGGRGNEYGNGRGQEAPHFGQMHQGPANGAHHGGTIHNGGPRGGVSHGEPGHGGSPQKGGTHGGGSHGGGGHKR